MVLESFFFHDADFSLDMTRSSPGPVPVPPCLQAPPPVVSSDAHIGGAKLYESKQEMKPAHKAVVTPRTTQGMESIRLTIKTANHTDITPPNRNTV